MYQCPECKEEMVWNSDNEVDGEEEVYMSFYTCRTCCIDLTKFWGDRAKDVF